MMKKIAIAALMAGAAISNAHAANVYNVSISAGSVGQVTGTMTTDGTLGILSAANFLSWNLNVVGDGAVDVLTNLNSNVFASGASTTATASNIFFDFGNVNPSFLLFQKIYSSGSNYVCAASTPYPSTPCIQGTSIVPEYFQSPSAQYSLPKGNQIIASIGGGVPEPATWAMMMMGFGAIGASMRRRTKMTVSFA